ncbi:ABC transporter substrate-binding protein [Actinomadura flavalba]|uniref:ABC transporter substrate-binding protein n=1 Tax=Actinomadura flavalba TaxID=1120938 RepID=UPI000365AA34|nr:ABC transporter substrate-binding protein [Actinomadura flavalba]
MNTTFRRGRAAAVAAVTMSLVLAAAACSGKASEGGGDGDVKTGPGVTDDKITVTALTDLTGVYAALGKGVTQAQKLYFDGLNKQGGVCGRDVELVVRDHGYDVQKALAAYSEMAPKSAAIPQLIGSPITMALRSRIENDKLLTIPQAWAHTLLGSKYVQVTGTTYDIDMINAISFLRDKQGVKSGDTIGHLRLEGDYGQSALAGVKYAAEKGGLKVAEQQVKPTDADMTAQVAAFRRANVKAILVSVAPRQAASLVGVAAASGLKVPMVGSNSAFAQQLLATPAGPAFEASYYIAQASPPISADVPGLKKLAADYQAAYKGEPLDLSVVSGYSTAAVIGEALKRACAKKDLTREGIVNAHRDGTTVDLGLGLPKEDYTQWTKAAARATYISRPDKNVLGGTKVEVASFESPEAKSYDPPAG